MLQTILRPVERISRRCRLAISTVTNLELRSVRPSLLDRRFLAEACIVELNDGTLALRLGDYNLTQLTGLALDVPSMNQILDRMRHLCPRS